jgi:hypothetical protein
MTPNEITFWKVVCALLVIACIRVHSIGFLATSVLVYYLLLSAPKSDKSDVSTDFLADNLVSARLATTEEENPTPDNVQPDKVQPDKVQPDKVPNWRKAVQQSGSASNTVFSTTSARQPTAEQKNRLMKALYDEMKMK